MTQAIFANLHCTHTEAQEARYQRERTSGQLQFHRQRLCAAVSGRLAVRLFAGIIGIPDKPVTFGAFGLIGGEKSIVGGQTGSVGKMKAIVQERYGSPDVLQLREVEKPVAGDDDVLVRVRAASVHPDVWHVVSGRPYVLRLMGAGFSRPRQPIPGTDMAGIVESVGKGVIRFRPGNPVFGETIAVHQWINGGAFAEYVSVPQHLLARKPDNITFEQAASVPSSGYIALLNLRDPSRLRPGQTVLINGAGGGVGSLALQLAKAYGAHVTAVDTTRKLGMLRSLGADEVIDYTREDFTRLGIRYDLIFDVPGNHPFSACRRALKPDGRYVLIGHERFGASGKRVFGLVPRFLGLIFLSRFVKQLRGQGRSRPSSTAPTL